MDYEACLEYILNIPLYGRKAGLNNIQEIMRRLGDPQDQLQYIHVAGTNGKGSVCTMLAYIYGKAGLNVGLFTSPHLILINERIQINHEMIPNQVFSRLTTQIKEIIGLMVAEGLNHPTFFEVLFAIAILYFFEQKVDLVILETGVGGRLDATNIVKYPLANVITQIDYDHVQILGNTFEAIAAEKGGIIKSGAKVVLQDAKSEVKKVIQKICMEKDAQLYEVHPYRHLIFKKTYKSIDFSINSKYYEYDRLIMNTNAKYQMDNLATALTVIAVLQKKIPVNRYSIDAGVENFYWPARMEIVNENVLIDGAHNKNGISAFIEYIEENFQEYGLTIVFAVMKDKDYDEMISLLCQCKQIRKIIVIEIHKPRGMDAEKLCNSFHEHGFSQVFIEEDIKTIINKYVPHKQNELLCFVGSLYLAGEVKKILLEDELNDKF